MATRRSYFDLQNQDRRNFVKWSLGIGAALGLRPWKVFEVAESVIGPAAAQTMATRSTHFSIHNLCNNGGFAWMTQMFPVGQQSTIVGSGYYKPNQAVPLTGSAKPMLVAPDSMAFRTGNKQISAFLCGNNETHSQAPNSAVNMPSGNRLAAFAASLQASNPTLIPAILIGGGAETPFYGQAAGAPALTVVPSADEFANLFAAKAGQAGFALADTANANKYGAYFKALMSLHRAANRSTFTAPTVTNKAALSLLAQKLGDQLRATNADLNRYGVDVGAAGKVQNIARALITTAKAFQLGLTNSVSITQFGDDPHGAYNITDMMDSNHPVNVATKLCGVWDAFMADVMGMADPQLAGQKIGDNLVITWTGDTYKNPRMLQADQQNGGLDWGDGTPSNTNIMYVMSNGVLKSGWYGDIHPTDDNMNQKWNPGTGANVALNTMGPDIQTLGQYVATAVGIAVNRGKDLPQLTAQLPAGLGGIANISQQ